MAMMAGGTVMTIGVGSGIGPRKRKNSSMVTMHVMGNGMALARAREEGNFVIEGDIKQRARPPVWLKERGHLASLSGGQLWRP